MPRRLIDELNDLHASYVKAVTIAVADGDLAAAEAMVRAYDEDSFELVADWEDRGHTRPARRKPLDDSSLRRLLDSLTRSAAA